jgi:predicted RNase H-like HicB family nuclease
MKNYIALIEVDENNYGVVFPDFPGLTTVGDSYEEAVQLAHEALAGHTSVMKAAGEKLPEPRTLAQIKDTWEDWNEWKGSDYFVAGIALLPPYGTQKVLLSIDSGLVAKIDAVARNRSAFFASAAQRYIDDVSCPPVRKAENP